MIQQTTWQDIARSYRKVIEQVIHAFANTYGNEVTEKLVSVIEAIDTEADLLAKSEEGNDAKTTI